MSKPKSDYLYMKFWSENITRSKRPWVSGMGELNHAGGPRFDFSCNVRFIVLLEGRRGEWKDLGREDWSNVVMEEWMMGWRMDGWRMDGWRIGGIYGGMDGWMEWGFGWGLEFRLLVVLLVVLIVALHIYR